MAIAVAALVPLLTLALYLTHGSPDLPSYPMAGRTQFPLEQANVGELIAKVEARLREHPEDGQGWDVIAPIYFKLGRFREAAAAYANAARLEGETVRRLAGFAESDRARRRRHRRRGGPPRLREDPASASPAGPSRASGWRWPRSRTASSPTRSPTTRRCWRRRRPKPRGAQTVEGRIAEVSRRIAGTDKASRRPRALAPQTWRRPSSSSPEDRARMIAQMVDGLAQRLKRDGRDLAGWLRLINAYAVLDRKEDARAALAEARQNFTADEKALAELAALAKSLGLGS